MNERAMLLRQIQSVRFSMWELHIFLDTHPNHAEATQMMQEYQEKSEKLIKKFEEKFGPLNSATANINMWEWITTPWPWENDDMDKEECKNVDL